VLGRWRGREEGEEEEVEEKGEEGNINRKGGERTEAGKVYVCLCVSVFVCVGSTREDR
jgi:hypothetical protein